MVKICQWRGPTLDNLRRLARICRSQANGIAEQLNAKFAEGDV